METRNIYALWSATFENAIFKDLKQCFSIIIEQYTNPNRYYHNLNHIGNLISQIEPLSLPKDNKAILLNVALFHDVIYISGSKNNERKSAEFAAYWLSKLNFCTIKSQMICNIIRSTNTHESSDDLTQLFLDLDLSILGGNEEKYLEYIGQIRKEHIQIPNYLYKIGRKRFLNHMLSREFIFSTSEYYRDFEKIARKNLNNELKALNK
jgi:predicted metal-dependent HD superfamily phosphohydrolase